MLAALLCAAAHDNAQVCASGHASGRCELFGDLEALRLKAGYCELLGLGHGMDFPISAAAIKMARRICSAMSLLSRNTVIPGISWRLELTLHPSPA